MKHTAGNIIKGGEVYQMAKAKVVSYFNLKGGTGKTTICALTGLELAASGKHILIIDGDPQSHMTKALARNLRFLATMNNVLTGGIALKDIAFAITEHLYLAPSSLESYYAEAYYVLKKTIPYDFLQKKLKESELLDEYDYILIDLAPAPTFFMQTAIWASDGVVVPLDTSQFSWNGINTMKNILELHKLDHVPRKYLANLVHGNSKDSLLMANDIMRLSDSFKTHIRKARVIEKAVEARMPLSQIDTRPRRPYKPSEAFQKYLEEFEEWLNG